MLQDIRSSGCAAWIKRKEECEMKITKKTGVVIAIVAIAAMILFDILGIGIGLFLYFSLLIVVGYIIINEISKFTNRLIDALAKRQAVSNEEINTKMELMMQRMQIIENKVDTINTILEKSQSKWQNDEHK